MKKFIKEHKYITCEMILFLILFIAFLCIGCDLLQVLITSVILAAALGAVVIFPFWFLYEFVGLGPGKMPWLWREKKRK